MPNRINSETVHCFLVDGLVFTPELVALARQTPIFADALSIVECDFAQLTPIQFREALLHFSPSSLVLGACNLRACQISDEFVAALIRNRVLDASLGSSAPLDGGRFSVTDDAIVDFCTQADIPVDREEDARDGELYVYGGSFTNGLFKRLIQTSSASPRTQPLRIAVSPSLVDDEDLRELAPYLSYRQRGQPEELRIYDLSVEQHGTGVPVNLQIVLSRGGRLEMIRAERDYYNFYKPDE